MIVALDPSLRCFGWAALYESGELRAGAFEPAPIRKKRHLYEGDAMDARLRVIAQGLMVFLDQGVEVVYAEAPAGTKTRSYNAVKALWGVHGLVYGLCFNRTELRLLQAHEAKVALTGRRDASKQDMVEAAKEVPGGFHWIAAAGSQPRREAIADAIGVLVAAGKVGRGG